MKLQEPSRNGPFVKPSSVSTTKLQGGKHLRGSSWVVMRVSSMETAAGDEEDIAVATRNRLSEVKNELDRAGV
jgi:hypothetical protein